MPKVSIEADARWTRDVAAGRYVELCRGCGVRRDEGHAACSACGAPFVRLARRFFAHEWTPAQIDVRFPTECPCCGRPATRTRSYWCSQYTRARPPTRTDRKLDVPVCERVRSPLFAWLGMIVSAVFGVLGLTALLDPQPGELVVLAASVALFVWSFRVYTRVRFSHFDHRRYVIRARRRAWAEQLAALNDGRM